MAGRKGNERKEGRGQGQKGGGTFVNRSDFLQQKAKGSWSASNFLDQFNTKVRQH